MAKKSKADKWTILFNEVSSLQKETIQINKRRIAIKKRAILLFNRASRRQAETFLLTQRQNYQAIKNSLSLLLHNS